MSKNKFNRNPVPDSIPEISVPKTNPETENLMSQQRTEELYQKAIDAMRRYNGSGGDEDDEYDEEY